MRANEFHISDPVEELAKKLPTLKKIDYDAIDELMQRVCYKHKLSGQRLHDLFVKKYGHTPDTWVKKIKQRNEEVSEDDMDEGILGFLQGNAQKKNPTTKIDYNAVRQASQASAAPGKVYRDPRQYYQDQKRSAMSLAEEPEVGFMPYNEEVDSDDTIQQINKFVEWAKKTLHVKGDPKFTFSKDTAKAQEGHHTGVHSGNDIWVYIGNRNLVDIFRTVFHELVHQRQDELGMIKQGDSYPGSPIEAMADMLAGKYIKIYGKQHPEIFQ